MEKLIGTLNLLFGTLLLLAVTGVIFAATKSPDPVGLSFFIMAWSLTILGLANGLFNIFLGFKLFRKHSDKVFYFGVGAFLLNFVFFSLYFWLIWAASKFS